MPKPAELRDFAERYTAAWCSGNASSVAACYSPNGSLTINTDAPAQGREGIAMAAQSFMTAFPDLQVLMDDIEMQGDRAVYHWTLSGTNTGPGALGSRCVSVVTKCGRSPRTDSLPSPRDISIARPTSVSFNAASRRFSANAASNKTPSGAENPWPPGLPLEPRWLCR